MWKVFVLFCFVILPSSTYLFTVGAEGFSFHLITTVGRTPLDEGSARRRRPIPDYTNTVQETNIHAAGGIRTHDPSKRAAADLSLRPRGYWNRLCGKYRRKKIRIIILKEINHLVNLGMGRWIMLELIFQIRLGVWWRVWYGLVWLWVGENGWLLWIQ
jgi:hypothetical protein